MKMTWKLDDKRVNGATLFFSMIGRALFLLAAIAIFAAAQPWLSFGQLVVIAASLLVGTLATNFTLEFAD